MRHITPVDHLSDRELLAATERAATDERHLTAELLALLGEVDARRLYLGQSCASLFTYCTQALHLSEHAAYHRIEAARAVRQFPIILDMVAEGALTLTTVTLLGPHLTMQNHAALLDAARHKSKREVEHQIAYLRPGPMSARSCASCRPPSTCITRAGDTVAGRRRSHPIRAAPAVTSLLELPPRVRATLAPLSPERYLLKVTLSAETHAKLRRAQDLIRHTIPNGDPAVVIDRALTLLVGELERTKVAKIARSGRTSRSRRRPSPRCTASAAPYSGIHPPRRVGTRRGTLRVRRRARPMHRNRRLEFHHRIPFADGGPTSIENLSLRCRAHNAHEARQWSAM